MLDALPRANFIQSRQKLLLDLAARKKFTWRELIRVVSDSRGHLMVVGTPDDIANTMVDTFDQRAAGGFNVLPATLRADSRILLNSSFPNCGHEPNSDGDTPDKL